jgi:Putative MetA-pathway of phenol degradation
MDVYSEIGLSVKAKNALVYFGILITITAGVFCWPHIVMAQAPNADPELHIVEPIITEETMPNEPGDWDLRFSGSYLWLGAGGSGFLPRSQLFFGIANRWGAEIEVPWAFIDQGKNHYGIGDISVTVKFLVRKPGARMPGFVLGMEMTFPSGNANNGLGEGILESAPFGAIVFARRRWVLQGNTGYSVVHKVQATDASNHFFYNAAAAFPYHRFNSYLVCEINGSHSHTGNRAAFSPGLKYSLTPERFVAIAMPVGLNSLTPRLGIVLQIQITLHSADTNDEGTK